MEYTRKTTGITLLKHLAVRKGRAKTRNHNGIVEITVGDAEAIISDFNSMKAQRDEALRILGLRCIPNQSRYIRE